MTNSNPQMRYEWAGTTEAVERLTAHFYDRARLDPVLARVFAGVPGDHTQHVLNFVANVFGDPDEYGEARDGHSHVLARHLGRRATLEQRRRWMDLLLESADDIGMSDDPEFRSALVAYLEWGSRIEAPKPRPGATFVMTC
jgi:hemoglobin